MPSPSPLVRRGRRGRLLWMVNDDPEMDTAAIRVCNGLGMPVEVFWQLTECADCSLQSLSNGPIDPHSNSTIFTLTTSYGLRLEVRDSTATAIGSHHDDRDDLKMNPKRIPFAPCSLDYHFDEYGQYTWNVTANYTRPEDGQTTTMTTTMETTEDYYYGEEPPTTDDYFDYGRMTTNVQMDCKLLVHSDGYPTYLPILVYGFGVLVALPLTWLLLAILNRLLRIYANRVYKIIWTVLSYLCAPKTFLIQRSSAPAKPKSDQNIEMVELPATTSATGDATADSTTEYATADSTLSKEAGADNSRLVCIDVIRGIAISIMIFGTPP